MKVLLVNGSPHQNGCTHTALAEAAADLLGYMIYLGVFAAPVWYFYTKKKEDEA